MEEGMVNSRTSPARIPIKRSSNPDAIVPFPKGMVKGAPLFLVENTCSPLKYRNHGGPFDNPFGKGNNRIRIGRTFYWNAGRRSSGIHHSFFHDQTPETDRKS